MRSGPGTDFDVIGIIHQGAVVEVSARNTDGAWWLVCCASDSAARGWTSAQYLLARFDVEEALPLLPVINSVDELEVPSAKSETDSTNAGGEPSAQTGTTGNVKLELQVKQDPLIARQGQFIDLVFTVSNPTQQTARNVQLRNELPASLTFVDYAASVDGTLVQETGSTTVFNVLWEELAPEQKVSASVTVEISSNLPNGSVVDNIAVALADNADTISGGVSIGLPPSLLPDFK